MQIVKSEFFIPKPDGGVIFGEYDCDEGIALSGTALESNYNGWTGASFLSKKDQIKYLGLLNDAYQRKSNKEDKMLKQLEETERELMAIYAEFKKIRPDLHKLTFEIDKYDHLPNLKLHGFYHEGDNCKSYDNINVIYDLWRRHEILFQKFSPL